MSFDAGEWSDFHVTHGFYIEGVGKRTAILPPNWEYRLVGVCAEATNNATGSCLDPHDLCAAKLMAHREKDFVFVTSLLQAGLLDPGTLHDRVASIDVTTVQSDQDLSILLYRQAQSLTWIITSSTDTDTDEE